jgi:hypothetical protein
LPSTANRVVFAVCALLARVSGMAALTGCDAVSAAIAKKAAVIARAEM